MSAQHPAYVADPLSYFPDDAVDAKDTYDDWWPALVIARRDIEGKTPVTEITIRFQGWGSSCDRTVRLPSPDVMPRGFMVVGRGFGWPASMFGESANASGLPDPRGSVVPYTCPRCCGVARKPVLLRCGCLTPYCKLCAGICWKSGGQCLKCTRKLDKGSSFVSVPHIDEIIGEELRCPGACGARGAAGLGLPFGLSDMKGNVLPHWEKCPTNPRFRPWRCPSCRELEWESEDGLKKHLEQACPNRLVRCVECPGDRPTMPARELMAHCRTSEHLLAQNERLLLALNKSQEARRGLETQLEEQTKLVADQTARASELERELKAVLSSSLERPSRDASPTLVTFPSSTLFPLPVRDQRDHGSTEEHKALSPPSCASLATEQEREEFEMVGEVEQESPHLTTSPHPDLTLFALVVPPSAN